MHAAMADRLGAETRNTAEWGRGTHSDRAYSALFRAESHPTTGMRSKTAALACWVGITVLMLAHAPAAHAYSSGISSATFGGGGCPSCHVGGAAPMVLLSGPAAVAPGDTVDYTLTIFGSGTQHFGGFNVAASAGTLSTGGGFAAQTKTILGLLSAVEITHSSPKQGDFLSVIEFSFRWTAPNAFSTATLRGWGNAVNNNGNTNGDAAALDTLTINMAQPPPTPTPMSCANAASLQPAFVSDPGARRCQAAIAKAGAGYLKKALKAVRKCLKIAQAATPGPDPIALCAGTAATAPSDPDAAAAIAKAENKVRAVLAARCSDAAVSTLDSCASTESGLEDCLIAQHHQAVLDAIANQYGSGAPVADPHAQKCQAAIGTAASHFLLAQLGAAQSCLLERFGEADDGAALCIGSVAGGVFTAPTDPSAAAAMAKAETKLAGKIARKCDAAQISVLDTCDFNPLGCLLCTHRSDVFDLLATEFGGTP
jgi:hypothetical protein